ncbi:AraC family transcriptional regulator [Rhizobium sp. LjRoot254]|uniref:AraC family transcriptional regulator n=1 Tax=Rhizobium sp. LjRoot254 TaxID=3342297 RepID=UPI003ECEBD13
MTQGEFRILHTSTPGVTAVVASSRHSFARHTHEEFGIGVIEHGAQKSLSGRGMVEAGAGNLITVNPGEVHDGIPIGDEGRTWSILYFRPELVAEAAADVFAEDRQAEITHPVMADPLLASRFRGLFRILTSMPDAGLAGESGLLDIVARVICERRAAVVVFPDIRHARAMIDDDPSAGHTLAGLAREAGLSRFQLLRAFEKTTGLTAHAYIVQRRVDLARRLIADGVSLAEAAASSGFSDQSHMTRVFVSKYGISPGKFAGALN